MKNLLLAGTSIALWIIIGVILFAVIIMFAVVPVNLWFRCLVSGTYVRIFKLVGMRLRKVNANMVVDSYINAKKAGLNINIDDL